MSQSNTYKIILAGDGDTGKTTFIKRHRTGEFETRYVPTMGVEVHPLTFPLSNGSEITFNVWDCAGDERFRGLEEGYYIGAQGAIVFFDVGNRESYKHADKWVLELRRVCGNIPIVLCGNKCDARPRLVRPKDIYLHLKRGLPYFDISSRSNYNFEKPFLALCRSLLKNDQLHFAAPPPPLIEEPVSPTSREREVRDRIADMRESIDHFEKELDDFVKSGKQLPDFDWE